MITSSLARFAGLTLDFYPDVGTAAVDELRALLRARDVTYRRVAGALADPRGHDGRRLAEALDAILDGEPIGALRLAFEA